MKKLLLGLVALIPLQTIAADSVYSWGKWDATVKPAAGGIVSALSITPGAVEDPEIAMRANEAEELTRLNFEQVRYIVAQNEFARIAAEDRAAGLTIPEGVGVAPVDTIDITATPAF